MARRGRRPPGRVRLEPMPVPRRQHPDPMSREAGAEGSVRGHDPGTFPDRDLQHRVVATALGQNGRKTSCKRPSRGRPRSSPTYETVELAQHGRRHADDGAGPLSLDLGFEGKTYPNG
jgi:hypothetical protein